MAHLAGRARFRRQAHLMARPGAFDGDAAIERLVYRLVYRPHPADPYRANNAETVCQDCPRREIAA